MPKRKKISGSFEKSGPKSGTNKFPMSELRLDLMVSDDVIFGRLMWSWQKMTWAPCLCSFDDGHQDECKFTKKTFPCFARAYNGEI